jgi:SurA N-terminal domain
VRRTLVLPLALGAAVLAAALLAGRGEDEKTVARVGGEPITETQLAEVVEHFRTEAQREGEPFPDEDSALFRTVRNRLLRDVLVYRTALRQAARRLGITVTPAQVLKRLHPSGGSGDEDEGRGRDSFEYGSVEAQLLIERIFRKVTRDVRAPTQAELSARRNRALTRYLARFRRETRVRYERGYAPSP